MQPNLKYAVVTVNNATKFKCGENHCIFKEIKLYVTVLLLLLSNSKLKLDQNLKSCFIQNLGKLHLKSLCNWNSRLLSYVKSINKLVRLHKFNLSWMEYWKWKFYLGHWTRFISNECDISLKTPYWSTLIRPVMLTIARAINQIVRIDIGTRDNSNNNNNNDNKQWQQQRQQIWHRLIFSSSFKPCINICSFPFALCTIF